MMTMVVSILIYVICITQVNTKLNPLWRTIFVTTHRWL